MLRVQLGQFASLASASEQGAATTMVLSTVHKACVAC